ncbi:DUF2860 domain-containing protein [Marinicauda algicola]|uniref:DUF2860 domain-containing protein n=1 Tax=Marinicauda algicola TaxID=2029849 RepID=A0A4V3RYH3_9PROT|nr:outer membrane beta-barrel protein [Marinicauda algicola]TGY90409.1 DUF2860 domain-containing protein [Marinicauda algicola]
MYRSALAIGLFAACAPAVAQEGRFELRSENQISRDDPFAADEVIDEFGLAGFDLETGFDTNTWVRRVQPVGGGAVWRFEGQVRARTYFDQDDIDSLLFTPRVQYWKRFAGDRFQFRIYGAYSHLSRDGDSRWTRPESEAQLRWRHDGERRSETVARLRVTHYDFEESFVAGLDQTRVRVGLEHFLRPDPEINQLRLSVFYEEGEADDDANSFTEVRVGAGYDHAIREGLTVSFQADYRDREYEAPFSSAFPFQRADERFLAEARVEKKVSEHVTAFAGAGYLENSSNIATRDYGGATFRVGLRAEF